LHKNLQRIKEDNKIFLTGNSKGGIN